MQYMIEEDCNCDEHYSAVTEDFELEIYASEWHKKNNL